MTFFHVPILFELSKGACKNTESKIKVTRHIFLSKIQRHTFKIKKNKTKQKNTHTCGKKAHDSEHNERCEKLKKKKLNVNKYTTGFTLKNYIILSSVKKTAC